ncbi:MAG TPA: NDMA-dependent alcohol dehydrogenase [Streptosporangiaceae bacterium]|nr:NDMA-dependent alcohol dehydrogenase [Streptosporangiaceae bacterium]
MKTQAAILRKPGSAWEIAELELDPPKDGEVLVRFVAAGLCHSDEHIRAGEAPIRMPLVGGHEGAGIVEDVGPGVTRVAPGDHIVCSFVPICGMCYYCASGRQGLCEAAKYVAVGCLNDETFRFHAGGEDFGGMCMLGTFARFAVVTEWSCVKIDPEVPLELAALLGCGVPTGWGSAVRAAGVRVGDTAVIFGVGGVGINAVQGAHLAGARHVVAVDPVEFKREKALELGATHAAPDAATALDLVAELTGGRLADQAIVTVGALTAQVINEAVGIIGKGGVVMLTSVGNFAEMRMDMSPGPLIGPQRTLKGALMGGVNPLSDIPRLVGLYRSGQLKLGELITRRYRLDQINDGFQDMLDGKNIRGLLVHEHEGD